MDFLTIVFLVYSFIAFYFLFLFVLIWVQNKNKIHAVPPITKNYTLSIVIPCYNEEKNIGKTIENLIKNGYSNLKKIIIVDDQSLDNSYKIIKSYEKKYPGIVQAVQTPKNTGCAAGAKNYGAKFVKTELIGFTDADSFVEKGAIEKTMGFFDEEKVGAVTSTVLVYNRNNFLEKLQAIEYIVIKFTRKLLEFVDSIYVTPGPLAIYKKKVFEEIGGFDSNNMTEDIEITWNLLSHGYKIKMSVPSKVYSVAPSRVKGWFKQRLRWNMGGVQTMFKYRKAFFKNGMLGAFVLPFFIFSWLIGVFGLSIFLYRIIRLIVLKLISASYSVKASEALLHFQDIQLVPNVLLFMGLVVFVFSLTYTLIAFLSIKEQGYKRPGIIPITFYMFFYLLIYPVILVVSAYKLIIGDIKW
ncbi:MAG: glycosyltransferase family 2 protein [Candidatus Pacearchaeota archaeon]|jgi:cellulose synthase/poly-beta-1,6-N-acetylglucosamine synthase-like glycosyltransferase